MKNVRQLIGRLGMAGVALAGASGCRTMIDGRILACFPRPDGTEGRRQGPITTQVGREVTFLFVVEDPDVNYAVIKYGERFVDVVASPSGVGRFRFKRRFLTPTPPDGLKIKAQAYVQQGTAYDWVPDASGWILERGPTDKADIPSGKGKIVAHVYEAIARFELPADKKYDWERGLLQLHALPSGREPLKILYAARGTNGFRIKKSPDGAHWIVYYRPNPEELRADGSTRVEFGVFNQTDDFYETFEGEIGADPDRRGSDE